MIPYFQPFFVEIPIIGGTNLTLHAFGIMAMAAFFISIYVAEVKAKQMALKSDFMFEIYILLIVGIVVGGHLGYVLMYKPNELINNPKVLLELNTGLSSFGGIATCLLLVKAYTSWRKIRVEQYLVPIVYAFPIGWFVARLGCTINHEHPGTETTFFLGRYCRPVEGATWSWPSYFNVPQGDLRFAACVNSGPPVWSINDQVNLNSFNGAIGVHDMGLYEALYALIVSLIFYTLYKKNSDLRLYFSLLIFTYLPLRFFMDFFRPLRDNPRYYELTPAQWFCIIGLTIACTYLYREKTKERKVCI